jgi:cytochrome c oxidase cbb3-type subunit 3
LHEALEIEPQVGVVLPCTITVIEREDGKVQLLTGNVQAMLTLFDNPKLTAAFQDLEDKYQAIIDEVTL